MAAGPLLVSEPLQRFRALGLAGDPVWRAAGQLRAAIASRLSRAHADLLAIPEAEPSGRTIDWYAPFDGEVKRLSDLGETEKREILDQVHRLHGEIAGLATQMEAVERSSAERNFARLLRHALTAPGEETLYVVGGRPVMTFWGFTADAALPGVFLPSLPPVVTPRVAAPHVARPEAVMASAPAIAAVAAPRTVWWQWLLLGVLLMLILALLAWLVRPYLPRIEPYIEAEARERALRLGVLQPMELQQTRVSTLANDNEELRLELARLTDELSRRGGDCAAGVVVPGGVVGYMGGPPIERGAGPDLGMANDPSKDANDPNKPDDKGAGVKGPDEQNKDKNATAQNDPRNGPKNDPKNDAMNNAQNKKDEPKPMVVPPEAKQKQELAFLKGDWRSRTGLATATGEKDIRPSYTLDDKGKGKVSFTQKNGATCEAPAEARWDGSKLVIEEKSNPRCSDGKTYARNTVNCEIGADGAAQCKGSQPGDPRSYQVQIGR